MLDVILFKNKSCIIEFLPGIETGAFFIFVYLKNFTTLKKIYINVSFTMFQQILYYFSKVWRSVKQE